MAEQEQEGIDWGALFGGAAGAAGSYAVNAYQAEQDKKDKQKQYEFAQENLMDQLGRFDKDFSLELGGGLTEQEKANRELLLNKTKLQLDREMGQAAAQLTQQYARAGVGGQELATALQELRAKSAEALANRATELDAFLMDKASSRSANAKQTRMSLLNAINQQLTPLEYAANKPVDTGALAVKAFLPAAVAGGVAMAGRAIGGDKYTGPTAEQAFGSAGVKQGLESVGLKPEMFSSGSKYTIKDGQVYEKGAFNVMTGTYDSKYVSADKVNEGQAVFDPVQGKLIVPNPKPTMTALYNKNGDVIGYVPTGAKQAPIEKPNPIEAPKVSKEGFIPQGLATQENGGKVNIKDLQPGEIEKVNKMEALRKAGYDVPVAKIKVKVGLKADDTVTNWDDQYDELFKSIPGNKTVVREFPDGSVLYSDGTTGSK